MATMDNINELIENIEKDGFNYIIGIIKPKEKDKTQNSLEIFTNYGDNGLNKLLKILQDHKRARHTIKEEKTTKTISNE